MKVWTASCTTCFWQHRCWGEKCSDLYSHAEARKEHVVRYGEGVQHQRHETITMMGTLGNQAVGVGPDQPTEPSKVKPSATRRRWEAKG